MRARVTAAMVFLDGDQTAEARIEAAQSVSYARMAALQQAAAQAILQDPDVDTLSAFIGVDAATQARASEPFFTTKRFGAGSGLGLPMVYGFAKQSGGGMRIESAPGEGCAVTLVLPCMTGDLEDELTLDANWASVDGKFPPLLDASRAKEQSLTAAIGSSEAQLKVAQAMLESARAQTKQKKAALDQAQIDLETELVAAIEKEKQAIRDQIGRAHV